MALRFSLRSPLAFLLLASGVYAVAAFTVSRLATLPDPEMLAAALTLDLTLLVPALYYGVLVRGRSWPTITVAPVFVFSVVAASFLIPDAYHGTLDRLHLVVPLVEVGLLAVLVLRARAVVGAYRAAPSADAYDRMRTAIRAALGDGLSSRMLAYEAAVLRYALVGWREQPIEEKSAFGYVRTSGYGGVLLGILIAAVLELVAGHILLHLFWSPTAALVHLALSGYALLWFLGDYQAMRLRPIRVDDEAFALRLGLRWDARIPTAQIAGVRRLEQPLLKAKDTLNATPLGRLRYLIELREPVVVDGPYGLRRTVSKVGIAVDDAERFEARLVEVLGLPQN